MVNFNNTENRQIENTQTVESPPRVGEIYVMPERFYLNQREKAGKGLKIVLIGGGIFIVCVVAAAIFVLKMPASEAPLPVVENVLPKEEIAPPPEEVKVVEEKKEEPAPLAEEITEEPEISKEEESSPPVVTLPNMPAVGLDTDRDNFTDAEETIFGTGVNLPDTDEDGYLDGNEVANLYNPLAKEGMLKDSNLVKIYNNSQFGYSIFYPLTWVSRVIDNTGKEVIFNSDTGEFIQVIVEENSLGLSPLDWYLNQSPGIAKEQIQPVETKNFSGVSSLDTLTVYLVPKNGDGKNIFIVTYNIGTKSEMSFKTIFQMMVNSFTFNPGASL
ncbi:MAG: hypothetical protein PHD51_02635 [Patescibacteria group bacterium]|nr:hypothetical protein [Patescibacteria group bacterium]MDD5490245.1 hypothetical protein [Patescibacteria group bacterium]